MKIYKPLYCKMLADSVLVGNTIEDFCLKLKIPYSTFKSWNRTEKEFAEVVKWAIGVRPQIVEELKEEKKQKIIKKENEIMSEKYSDSFCEDLKKHLGKGLSFQSFAGVVEVSQSTLYSWVDIYPRFKLAKEIGNAKRLLKCEEILASSAVTGKGNANLQVFRMKNLGDGLSWKDKSESEVSLKQVELIPDFGDL